MCDKVWKGQLNCQWDNKGEYVQEFGIMKVMKVGGVEVGGEGEGGGLFGEV